MAGFTEGLNDDNAGQRLARAFQGRGAFRRLNDELSEDTQISCRHGTPSVTRETSAEPIEWLLDQGLIDDAAAHRFQADHPDPRLP